MTPKKHRTPATLHFLDDANRIAAYWMGYSYRQSQLELNKSGRYTLTIPVREGYETRERRLAWVIGGEYLADRQIVQARSRHLGTWLEIWGITESGGAIPRFPRNLLPHFLRGYIDRWGTPIRQETGMLSLYVYGVCKSPVDTARSYIYTDFANWFDAMLTQWVELFGMTLVGKLADDGSGTSYLLGDGAGTFSKALYDWVGARYAPLWDKLGASGEANDR